MCSGFTLPIEAMRFLNLPRARRLESVERHRRWQVSLDQDQFYDQIFGIETALQLVTAKLKVTLLVDGNLAEGLAAMDVDDGNLMDALMKAVARGRSKGIEWSGMALAQLNRSPFVKRLSTDGSASRFYLFNIALTAADILLGVLLFIFLYYGFNQSFDFAFDRAYYIAVLSFLWIHYYHDHFLFTRETAIDS